MSRKPPGKSNLDAETGIVNQQLTIAGLRACGHVADDAERHLQEMIRSLTRMYRAQRGFDTQKHASE
jgi:hypothetical protein